MEEQQPIGRRVAYWRTRRKMSQQLFADRLGKSKSWVDKVERGVRKLDRFSVIYEIADVLQIDVQLLLDKEPPRRPESVHCVDQIEVLEIRSALERYDKISTFGPTVPGAPPLTELRKAVDHAWMTYQHAKYGLLARSLPKLVRDAQTAYNVYTDGAGADSARVLGEVYLIASQTLGKLGEHELAWLAADRAIMVCERSGDDLLTALATSWVAGALSALGRLRPALEINVNVANSISPGRRPDATPQRLSVYGRVLSHAAVAAARLNDAATVRDLLDCAEEAAKQVGGDDNHYWTSFGPTSVSMFSVCADVELGDGARAVATHDAIDPLAFGALPPERRASHLLTVGRALVQTGDLSRACEVLLDAERLAPSELRCRPSSHELVAEILRRMKGEPPLAFAELADQMGLSG